MPERIKSAYGLVHILGSSIINRVISFFSGVLLVRIIPKIEYGSYSYALNIIATIEIFTAMGMVAGTFQLCSENAYNESKKKQIYEYGSAFGWKFNLGLSLLLIAIAFFFPFSIEESGEMLLFASLTPLSSVLTEFQNIKLRSDLKTREYAIANSIGTISIAVFTIVGAAIYRGKGALLLRSVSYIASFIIVFRMTQVGVSLWGNEIAEEEKKSLYSVSLVSMMNTGLSQLLYLVDIYVIGVVLTDSVAIASYKVATTIPTALLFIPTSIIIYIYPFFASHKDDLDWVWQKYKRIAFILFGLNIIIVIFLFSFAERLIVGLFGAYYTDSVLSFRILLINYLVTASLKILIGNIMVMLRKLKYNVVETLISSGLNITMDYYLIKYYSIEGAATATLIVTCVVSMISFIYLFYICKVSNGV